MFSPENIGEEQKKCLHALRGSTKKLKGDMLVSETFVAAFLLIRFRGLARVLSSARVPGVARSWPRASFCLSPALPVTSTQKSFVVKLFFFFSG